MKNFLSGLGWWLLGVAWLAVIILLFIGGARLAGIIEPWVMYVGTYTLLFGIPISLLLLILRQTRGWGGLGFYITSWPFGIWIWLVCLIYAVSISQFWAVLGVLAGGAGVVPVAAIMMLFRRDWSNLGGLLIDIIIVFSLRWLGLWIMARAEERKSAELHATALKEIANARNESLP